MSLTLGPSFRANFTPDELVLAKEVLHDIKPYLDSSKEINVEQALLAVRHARDIIKKAKIPRNTSGVDTSGVNYLEKFDQFCLMRVQLELETRKGTVKLKDQRFYDTLVTRSRDLEKEVSDSKQEDLKEVSASEQRELKESAPFVNLAKSVQDVKEYFFVDRPLDKKSNAEVLKKINIPGRFIVGSFVDEKKVLHFSVSVLQENGEVRYFYIQNRGYCFYVFDDDNFLRAGNFIIKHPDLENANFQEVLKRIFKDKMGQHVTQAEYNQVAEALRKEKSHSADDLVKYILFNRAIFPGVKEDAGKSLELLRKKHQNKDQVLWLLRTSTSIDCFTISCVYYDEKGEQQSESIRVTKDDIVKEKGRIKDFLLEELSAYTGIPEEQLRKRATLIREG